MLSTILSVRDRAINLQLVCGSSMLTPGAPGGLVVTLGQDGMKYTNYSFTICDLISQGGSPYHHISLFALFIENIQIASFS